MGASYLGSFAYSIDFQIRHIPVTNQHFSWEITTLFLSSLTVVRVKISKKNNFSSLKSLYHRLANRKKLIFLLEKYLKTLKDKIIGTAGTKLFESFTIFQSGRNMGM